jgi:hypothetical protein
MIKRFLGLAILGMGLAVPAHAQVSHGFAAGGAASPLNLNNAGGGGFGSGLGGNSMGRGKLTDYPKARFGVASVSGTQHDYVPSTFVSYDKALAEGRAVLATPPQSPAEAARQQVTAHTEKAKLALVQDDYGNAVIVPR